MTEAATFAEQNPNLVEWTEALAALLAVDVALVDAPTVIGASDQATRDVAPAAGALTAFLMGVAAGRAAADGPEAVAERLGRAAAQATMLAKAWPSDHNEADQLGDWLG